MTLLEQKLLWFEHYKSGAQQLKKAANIKGLVSAFNANIDAVVKLSGAEIKKLIQTLGADEAELMLEKHNSINHPEDALRGLIKCFGNGIAEEWIIENEQTFLTLLELLGTEKLQMGGQGGIVANVAAVCGVNPVYVHAASLPKEQAGLFLDLPNLKSFTDDGKAMPVAHMERQNDIPLIHYIIEFDKDDRITVNGKKVTCPKANRFIATYDPLNLKLEIDPAFDRAMASGKHEYDYLILSGYQLLQEKLPNGKSGTERIDESLEKIKVWRKNAKEHILHFEVASTQDKVIRKKLVDVFGNYADSIGVNERELIDIMEVIGKNDLADSCNIHTHAVNLFSALVEAFSYMNVQRIQLHMFGLYITIQRKGFKLTPLQNRNGMQTAALVAAAKASTGALNSADVLLAAQDKKVSDIGLNELNDLAGYIDAAYGRNELRETGIFYHKDFDVIAVPTIIIEKPITLVGMGDTISSVSLIGASM